MFILLQRLRRQPLHINTTMRDGGATQRYRGRGKLGVERGKEAVLDAAGLQWLLGLLSRFGI
jgi:hypothetical protein